MNDARHAFEAEGRLWLRQGMDTQDRARLISLMDGSNRPGARMPLNREAINLLESLSFVQDIITIWPGMRPVRLVGFQKHEGQNWALPWHQDRVICVKDRADLAGYSNWSLKGEDWHCQPPEDVLRNMLFVRAHIDESTAENGAMEIARGSHARGLISADQADTVSGQFPTEITQAAPGDVLILPMLTLHRSGPSKTMAARRVLRLDFASCELAHPLEWSG